MRLPFSAAAAPMVAFGLAIAIGISSQGATPTAEQSTTVHAGKKKAVAAAAAIPAVPNENAVGMLDHAYGILSHADHDYDGHRKRAMHQIEDAARVLGTKLSGDGRGDEKQGTSDTQLRKAQSLLESALGGLAGKPHRHIREAIKQLTVALHIK